MVFGQDASNFSIKDQTSPQSQQALVSSKTFIARSDTIRQATTPVNLKLAPAKRDCNIQDKTSQGSTDMNHFSSDWGTSTGWYGQMMKIFPNDLAKCQDEKATQQDTNVNVSQKVFTGDDRYPNAYCECLSYFQGHYPGGMDACEKGLSNIKF